MDMADDRWACFHWMRLSDALPSCRPKFHSSSAFIYPFRNNENVTSLRARPPPLAGCIGCLQGDQSSRSRACGLLFHRPNIPARPRKKNASFCLDARCWERGPWLENLAFFLAASSATGVPDGDATVLSGPEPIFPSLPSFLCIHGGKYDFASEAAAGVSGCVGE